MWKLFVIYVPPAFVYEVSISQHTNMIVYWSFTSKANRFAGCLTLQMVHFSSFRQPAGLFLQCFDDFQN